MNNISNLLKSKTDIHVTYNTYEIGIKIKC
nr:MAG TPA: hypothetical protein [Caudoviricetes sp.]